MNGQNQNEVIVEEMAGETVFEAPVAEIPASSIWLARIIKWTVLVTAFLAPLLYITYTTDILFVKVAVVEIAAVVAGAAWLLNVLVTKQVSYKRTPLNAAFLAAALALMSSTVFSSSPWSSFWGSDLTGEKTASILAFMVLAFVTAAVFRREDVGRAVGLVLISFLLLGVFALVSIFSGPAGFAMPPWLNANPIGTINAMALAFSAAFVFSLGLAITRSTSSGRKVLSRRIGWLSTITAIVLFTALVFIGFRMVWIGIGAIALLFTAFNFAKVWERDGSAASVGSTSFDSTHDKSFIAGGAGLAISFGAGKPEYALGGTAVAIAFLVLAASLFFSFKALPFVSGIFSPPIEISPSFRSTLTIGRKGLKSDPVLGVGPADFRSAFSQFRDPALNNTAFWQTRFGHGFSFMSTLFSTTGLLGLLVFLGLAAIGVGVIGRALFRAASSDPFLWAMGAASLFIFLEWFIYASNFTVSFLLFLFLGLFGALVTERANASVDSADEETSQTVERKSWWRISRRTILVDAPALNFITSLVVVFSAAFSLVALYALAAQYAAEVYFASASRFLTLYGNTDTAKVFLDRATALNPAEDGYYAGQAQVRLAVVNQIIAQASANPNQDLSAQFRDEFSQGVSAAQKAAILSPSDPDNWFMLGQTYEAVMLFIPGADQAAVGAYDRAIQADPTNPVLKLAKARVLISRADAASLQAGRAQGQEREQLDVIYKDSVRRAHEELDSAIQLKSDFAPARFLLAQIFIREGNVGEAIRKVEETASLAPQDVGVAFQLGFLYYRNDDFNRAEREFARAVTLNDNYSNARYFLGLIYDRRGERDAALAQFKKIADLNPGNEEVLRIIANLKAGRRALEAIVPPATAPEKRREAPVKEGERSKALERAPRR